ncbi:transcription factor BEE 3 [Cucumis sativus]|nr:transcription factor BEE 3 [Cucumis sativus]KAE8652462.1 hypothetical protein Csa_013397 [Cucumis sativus]
MADHDFPSSFPLEDPNLELMASHFSSSIPNFTHFLPFSTTNTEIFSQFPPNFPENNATSFTTSPVLPSHSVFPPAPTPSVSTTTHHHFHDINNKRKSMPMDVSESTSGISTPQVSESGFNTKYSSGKGKRLKSLEKEEEKSTREVVHVRARRGQATDSHSLAERVRRGKINERLRCLKDIVPGCYKTMGMAVMLDEIINYVQSLQNQVEFLSMKLAAASSFYDFNSEADAISKLQRAKAHEAKELERLMKEGYGGIACFHSNLPL